ncbi:ABC transporter transmembrane domain-containing protein [Rhizobium sp. L1K21]|uniref:ABC transporter transmembrane domain-containing protein n=1 Tax=Rhizobium sp. L1K21 TaxID=2954933 RepID=UPI002092E39C|nr:ABC transporter transmembrane domain-containing protein [Rhizobium sp. L1K21]MCO6185098.1 ABC transporter transmembrane domain-containing protein [Rhizobium sp. L1K21]
MKGNGLSNLDDTQAARRRSIKPLANLLPYLKHYKKMVASALFFLVLAAGTTLVLPLAVRRMIDHGFNADDADFINKYFIMLVAIAVVLAVASAMRYYFVISIGERIVSDLRRDVYAHIIKLSPSFFDVNQSGEIVSRLTADTTQVKSVVGATASLALRNTILCIGAIGMMVVTSPKLSGLVLIAIPFIVFPLVAFGRKVRSRSRNAQDTLADASAYANESIGAVRTVQAFNGADVASDRYGNAVEGAFSAAQSAIRSRSLLTGIAITMIFGSVAGILWVGAHSVLEGTMSAGTLSQFLIYSVVAAGSLGSLSEVWGEIAQASGAAERLGELLQEVPQIRAPENPVALPVPPRGEVSFDKVHFAYPVSPERSALNGLSFSVKPGETVAIVGPSGAGKSTLFSLIMRFYDARSGKVCLDGVAVKDADPKALRQRLSIVPQDVTIFASTIHDNIAYGRPGASRDEVIAAAKSAQAHEFIERLENGYDTVAGERGVTLSGGQRQRIAIARAILKDAPILLLDEATSALDAASEKLVQQALDGLMKDRTTLVIAHRLATVLKADRILVMDDGRIIEEGNHESLVAKGGVYAKLAALQFDQGEPVLQAAK